MDAIVRYKATYLYKLFSNPEDYEKTKAESKAFVIHVVMNSQCIFNSVGCLQPCTLQPADLPPCPVAVLQQDQSASFGTISVLCMAVMEIQKN